MKPLATASILYRYRKNYPLNKMNGNLLNSFVTKNVINEEPLDRFCANFTYIFKPSMLFIVPTKPKNLDR